MSAHAQPVLRFGWLFHRRTSTAPAPAGQAAGHVYASAAAEPGRATVALGRHRLPEPPRDLSIEQVTQVIPILDRVRRSLGLPFEEAVIFDRLAAEWRGLPGNQEGAGCG